jgi:iron complex outermembrane receptor protein
MNMNFRANVGNYVYNGMSMNTGAWSTVSYNSYQLNNLNKSYLKTGSTTASTCLIIILKMLRS